jgi:hypothetical protein
MLKVIRQGKQIKLPWLKIPSEINGDNSDTVGRETSRYLRNRKREYQRAIINSPVTCSKKKNTRHLYRGTNEYKRGHRPRSNSVKDDNGDLLADPYNILNIWKKYFSQLLNVCNMSDVKQTEIHTAEAIVSGASHLGCEISTANLKNYNGQALITFL